MILSAVPGGATVDMKWTSASGYELIAKWAAQLPDAKMKVLVPGKGEND